MTGLSKTENRKVSLEKSWASLCITLHFFLPVIGSSPHATSSPIRSFSRSFDPPAAPISILPYLHRLIRFHSTALRSIHSSRSFPLINFTSHPAHEYSRNRRHKFYPSWIIRTTREKVSVLREMMRSDFPKSDADRGKKRLGQVHQRRNSVHRRFQENRELHYAFVAFPYSFFQLHSAMTIATFNPSRSETCSP